MACAQSSAAAQDSIDALLSVDGDGFGTPTAGWKHRTRSYNARVGKLWRVRNRPDHAWVAPSEIGDLKGRIAKSVKRWRSPAHSVNPYRFRREEDRMRRESARRYGYEGTEGCMRAALAEERVAAE